MLAKIIVAATLVVATLAKTAQLTWYESIPRCCYDKNAPNQDECKKYSGCKYAGEFANDEKLSLDQLKNTPIVSFFDSNNPSESYWRKHYMNKKVKITKNGVSFTAFVKDTCSDADTDNNDCTRNAKGGFLIDVEFWTAKKYLGSTKAADGAATFEFV